MKNNVCVDLDGVLAQYDTWKGVDYFGDPIPGAKEFLERLSEFANIIIFTCRCNPEINGEASHLLVNRVRNWLDGHGFKYDHIYSESGKPFADAYIDDRAIICRPQDGDHIASYTNAHIEIKRLLKLKNKGENA